MLEDGPLLCACRSREDWSNVERLLGLSKSSAKRLSWKAMVSLLLSPGQRAIRVSEEGEEEEDARKAIT